MKRRPGIERQLQSGRAVPEADDVIELVSSRCPGKWIAVDLENGSVWAFERDGRPRHAGLTECLECDEAIEESVRQIPVEVDAGS